MDEGIQGTASLAHPTMTPGVGREGQEVGRRDGPIGPKSKEGRCVSPPSRTRTGPAAPERLVVCTQGIMEPILPVFPCLRQRKKIMNKMNWKWTLVCAAALVAATVLLDAQAGAGKPAPLPPPPPPIHYRIHYFTAPEESALFNAIFAKWTICSPSGTPTRCNCSVSLASGRSPRPSCCRKTTLDSVGLSMTTRSTAGISRPSLNMSTAQSACSLPRRNSSRDSPPLSPPPEKTAAAVTSLADSLQRFKGHNLPWARSEYLP